MSAARVLTASDAVALAALVRATWDHAPVARVRDDSPGDIIYGIARSIGDERGNFIREQDDVRDAWLRVTTGTGFEAFWPIAELLPEVKAGTFVVNYTK